MQINSNVNVRDFPQLTKALEAFMEKNNIHKDSAVLEKFLSDYSLTLEMPKEEKPIEAKFVDDVHDFMEYTTTAKTEFGRLKKLCSSILQEEKKAAEAAAAEAAAADTATAKAAAVEKQNANEKAQALKNYVLIRSVGIAEGELKSISAYLIDKFEISMKSFKKEEESKTDSWEDDVVKIHLDQHEKIIINSSF